MRITVYSLPLPIDRPIAVVSDFHSREGEMHTDAILDALRDAAPGMILFPGDIMNTTDTYSVTDSFNREGFSLLTGSRVLAPVFYSLGNHEHGLSPENRRILTDEGVTVLDNETAVHDGITIAGFTTGYVRSDIRYRTPPTPSAEIMSHLDGKTPTILLCHHPEYWEPYVRGHGIDLTVSGHAHGGQWSLFGQGVYAPGQGLFPRFTHGVHTHTTPGGKTEHLVISRGVTNSVPIPRFGNPCEVILIVPESRTSM